MLVMRIVIHETELPYEVHTVADLDEAIGSATAEACHKGLLSIVELKADNGNTMNIVLGGNETVLTFRDGHGDPPYYASKGTATEDEPVMTAFMFLVHHTEFPRHCVIPLSPGLSALREFFQSGTLPTFIQWSEV